jgi:hypothetical protein
MPPQQSKSSIQSIVERDQHALPSPPSSIAPSVGDTPSNADRSDLNPPAPQPLVDEAEYEGLDWKRVPFLERRQLEHNARGKKPSWIYKHGWPVWHRKIQKNYWLCRLCHHLRMPDTYFDAASTGNASNHLAKAIRGHSMGPNGAIRIHSKEGNIPSAIARSQVMMMRQSGVQVSQDVANSLAAGFSTRRFLTALKDWVAADNQSLRVIETPQFRELIEAANPLAEAVLWRNHQSLRDAIIAEYHSYVPAVAAHLGEAQSLIHISFDNWTSTGGKLALTGVCVHHLNSSGKLVDYLLGLPELHGAHSGDNIASVVSATMQLFGVDAEKVGYFVLDNAYNNDTAVAALADEYGFEATYRRLRCCCHILNLGAQLVI